MSGARTGPGAAPPQREPRFDAAASPGTEAADAGRIPVLGGGLRPSRNGAGGRDAADAELQALFRRMLELIGEDPDRPGLADTPKRSAKALRWLTRGYGQEPRDAIGRGMFEERHDSMVLVKDIELYSLCEHHLLPFHGRVHVAYVPDGRIVGLSKLARLVDVFARRLQVQERLTDEIADALCTELRPRGVGVVVEAVHLCMMMRGVEKQNSKTITSAVRGVFADCPMTREEFFQLAMRGG